MRKGPRRAGRRNAANIAGTARAGQGGFPGAGATTERDEPERRRKRGRPPAFGPVRRCDPSRWRSAPRLVELEVVEVELSVVRLLLLTLLSLRTRDVLDALDTTLGVVGLGLGNLDRGL